MQWCVQLDSGKVCDVLWVCQRKLGGMGGISAFSVPVQGKAHCINVLFVIFKLESVF